MTRDYYLELRRAVPGIGTQVACPEDDCYLRYVNSDGKDIRYTGSVLITVTHLNDIHKWTRERIADWLDTLDIDLTFRVPSNP